MPLNIDWQQILLHLFNFTLLFAILYFLLYKPVKAFMEKREKQMAERETAAEEKQAESERVKAEYEAKMQKAEAEIAARRRTAEEETAKAVAAARASAAEEARQIVAKAREDAEKEREETIKATRHDIAAAAAEMAERIVNESTSETYDAFLNAAGQTEGRDHA